MEEKLKAMEMARHVWQCCVDKVWMEYPDAVSKLLEAAAAAAASSGGATTVAFTVAGKSYEANLAAQPPKQKNKATGFEREMRRIAKEELLLEEKERVKAMESKLKDGVRFHPFSFSIHQC